MRTDANACVYDTDTDTDNDNDTGTNTYTDNVNDAFGTANKNTKKKNGRTLLYKASPDSFFFTKCPRL